MTREDENYREQFRRRGVTGLNILEAFTLATSTSALAGVGVLRELHTTVGLNVQTVLGVIAGGAL